MSGLQSSWLDNHPEFGVDPNDKDEVIAEGLRLATGKSSHVPNLNLLKTVDIPPKIRYIFEGKARYRGAYGGRGSGKSYNFALNAAIRGYLKKEKILCTREIQRTIEQSVMAQIIAAIEDYPFLKSFYEIGRSYIRGRNGTEFIFMGLRHNPQEIKSTYGVTICWVEEAEGVSEYSWRILIPTIRADNSELWITWNPESTDSETHRRFIDNPPPNSKIVKVNWQDNPYFPASLEEERQNSLGGDPEMYAHIWEGEPITKSEAQIFWDKCSIDEFTQKKHWMGPYFGLDFGFSNSPTAAVKTFIGDGCLWIERECGGRKLELDDTTNKLKKEIEGIEKHVIRADNSRPESISYLSKHGLPRIIGCEKGAGSVEDGITFIRNFKKIVIHSRCLEMQKEARLYSYKVDNLTGDVLPTIVKRYDNYWDATRYSIEPMIKNNGYDYGRIL